MNPKVKFPKNKPVTLYHSNDVCIVRQCGFWHDSSTNLLIVPCKAFALVAVVLDDVDFGQEKPFFGCIISRPRALELDIPDNVKLDFVAVDSIDMQTWSMASRPWLHIRQPTR